MDIRFRRERNENYMLIGADEEECQGYQVRMLESNHIGGLLRFRIEQINHRTECCYTISGCQTMTQYFGGMPLPLGEIKLLMAALSKTTGQLEEYLLDIDKLLLEPDFIFWKDDSYPEFCYYPVKGEGQEFRKSLRNLLQYILKRIDHKDDEAVAAVYGIYRISTKENFRMQDIIQFLYSDAEGVSRISRQEDEERFIPNPFLSSPSKEMPMERRHAQKREIKRISQDTSGEEHEKNSGQNHGQNRTQGLAIWMDWLFVFMIVGLAAAAIGTLLLKQYQKKEVASEKEWIICFSLVTMIAAASIGAARMLLGRTREEGTDQADVQEKAEEEGGKEGTFEKIHYEGMELYGQVREKENYFAETSILESGGTEQPVYWFRSLNQKQLPDFMLKGENRQVVLGKGVEPPNIHLNWPTVSRKHALFNLRNGICTVIDCGSRNGTYIDDVRLMPDEIHILLPGSTIRFADAAFCLEEPSNGETQLLAQEEGKCYTDMDD